MSSYTLAMAGCLCIGWWRWGATAVTRGDALLDTDPPVRAGEVLGRVESIERGGSRVAVAREVSWGRRVAGAVLRQSGRLARLFVCIRVHPWLRTFLVPRMHTDKSTSADL